MDKKKIYKYDAIEYSQVQTNQNILIAYMRGTRLNVFIFFVRFYPLILFLYSIIFLYSSHLNRTNNIFLFKLVKLKNKYKENKNIWWLSW